MTREEIEHPKKPKGPGVGAPDYDQWEHTVTKPPKTQKHEKGGDA